MCWNRTVQAPGDEVEPRWSISLLLIYLSRVPGEGANCMIVSTRRSQPARHRHSSRLRVQYYMSARSFTLPRHDTVTGTYCLEDPVHPTPQQSTQ
jgi:hypothetical protein